MGQNYVLQLNKKQINDQFLSPVSRISSECCLTVTNDTISTLVNDETGSVILYSKMNVNTGISDNTPLSLNIKDIRKLIKIFDCIPTETFTLNINDNCSVLHHKSPTLSFKMHLVTDNVIKKSTISLDKIIKLTFNTDFNLTSDITGDILKGSIFASNSDKIYFYTKDGNVYAELTDKSHQETDSITFNIANVYNGESISTPLPFNIEILRTINSTKYDKLTVKVNNTYKILLFELFTPDTLFKYIVPAYTK